QSHTVDLQGFSGDAGYPGAGTNQVQTNYMGLQVNFGNHNVLPSGAGVVFDLIDGHAFNVSRRVIGITIAPGNVVTLTGTSRVPQAVLDQLQVGANTIFSTSNGGDPFYYGANIGFRSVGPIVEGLFRYEVDIYIGVVASGYGACPGSEAGLAAPQPRDEIARLTDDRLVLDRECGCVKESNGGVR